MTEKLCVFCMHWSFNGGDPEYSEVTPGYDASMDCGKARWRKDPKRTSQVHIMDLYSADEFRKLIQRAETCPDYEQVET